MVGVFFRLKIRLLRARFTVSPVWSLIVFALTWIAAAGTGVSIGFVVGEIARQVDLPALMPFVFTLVTGMWVVFPLLAASIEQSLELEHFRMLPLTRSEMTTGMLTSSLVGPAPTATWLIFVIAAVRGYGSGLPSTLGLVFLGTVATILAVVAANVVTTAISVLFSGGRGRQLIGYLVMLVMVAPALSGPLLVRFAFEGEITAPSWLGWLYLIPPAGLGRGVIGLTSSASFWQFVQGAAYGSVWIGILMAWWGRLLVAERVPAHQKARTSESTSLMRRGTGPMWGVAVKEWLYFKRDPRIKMQLGGGLIGVAVILISSSSDALGAFNEAYLPFMAILVSFVLGATFDFNLFGLEGKNFWAFAVMPGEGRSVLLGKQVVWLGLATGVSVLVVGISGFLGGDTRYFGPAILTALCLATVWAGVGMISSVYAPFALPEDNLFANKHLSGKTFVVSFAGLIAAGLVSAIPLALIVWAVLRLSITWLWVLSVLSAGYGVLVLFGGLALASRLYGERLVEMVAELNPDQ